MKNKETYVCIKDMTLANTYQVVFTKGEVYHVKQRRNKDCCFVDNTGYYHWLLPSDLDEYMQKVEGTEFVIKTKRVLVDTEQLYKTAAFLRDNNQIYKDKDVEDVVRDIMETVDGCIKCGFRFSATGGHFVMVETSETTHLVDIYCDMSVGTDHYSTYIDLDAYLTE